MPTKTIIPGNLYIFNATIEEFDPTLIGTASVSGTVITYPDKLVEIHSFKIEEDYQNNLSIIPIPSSKGNRGQIPESRIVDLKRITETISGQGALEDEPSESATVKKENLKLMGKNNGELTLVWGTGVHQTLWRPNTNREHGVFINKMKFIETAGTYGESVTTNPPPFRKIDIQIQLVRGKDI